MEGEKEPFAFGEGTIMQLRDQVLELEDFGTRIAAGAPALTVAAERSGDATLEMKVDLLLQAVSAMQRRLDSIDQTLARALSR